MLLVLLEILLAVFNGSKILIWKQITTGCDRLSVNCSCIQWFKDTNLKANHNQYLIMFWYVIAVFNGSKILIWKQITTVPMKRALLNSCIQWFKDTNLKANHNSQKTVLSISFAVFNGSKILIWKQITTTDASGLSVVCCIQWFKDTNLKANHNTGGHDGFN